MIQMKALAKVTLANIASLSSYESGNGGVGAAAALYMCHLEPYTRITGRPWSSSTPSNSSSVGSRSPLWWSASLIAIPSARRTKGNQHPASTVSILIGLFVKTDGLRLVPP